MVSTQDFESCDPSSNLGRTFSFSFLWITIFTSAGDVKDLSCTFFQLLMIFFVTIILYVS